MKDHLTLYIPRCDELWFYRQMLSDPDTMAYNAPWFPPDGCIDFPRSEWEEWYGTWVGSEPDRFYAYLRRESDGAFVGGVNYHNISSKNWCDIGILIHASERGKGYGKQGLALLVAHAFRVDGVDCLHNEFEIERCAASAIHSALGFREVSREGETVHFLLTREEFAAE